MLFIALYSSETKWRLSVSLAFPLWCGLECKLDWSIPTNGPYRVLVLQLFGSAAWQRRIIFTHWQLWLSGLQSAKKRFTQMARERTWRMDYGGWFHCLLQASTYFHAKYFLSGLMCSCWHVCGPTWVRMHLMSASIQCVYLSATQTARGSYIGIVRTRQGALFPLCLPGAAFHPRWAGRLGWLLVWHSLDELGRKEGRHTAIHGHIMHTGSRRAELFSNEEMC